MNKICKIQETNVSKCNENSFPFTKFFRLNEIICFFCNSNKN